MSSINSVVLVGRLTRAPELRITPTGVSVATVTLAVDRRPNQAGEKEADFIDIVLFGRLAEIVSKYQDKGSMIGVEGRIQTRSFETKDRQKRKVFEIIADNVQFLTPKNRNQDTNDDFHDMPEPGEQYE
jgi:single-strand DNA-binding protein